MDAGTRLHRYSTIAQRYQGCAVFVPANTPIVVYVQGDKSDLKPGAKVFIAATTQPDGTLQGRAWRVGRDGVTPPM
jgi:hypothetical protein